LKKVAIAIGLLFLAISIFCGGFYSGWFLSDYDVLCEKNYTAHKLQKAFTSKDGIVLPEGTVVYLRGCKPNTDVRLEFFIDNWNYQHTEKLTKDPMPAYYLDIEGAGSE
jgi:hypothetical protein